MRGIWNAERFVSILREIERNSDSFYVIMKLNKFTNSSPQPHLLFTLLKTIIKVNESYKISETIYENYRAHIVTTL